MYLIFLHVANVTLTMEANKFKLEVIKYFDINGKNVSITSAGVKQEEKNKD